MDKWQQQWNEGRDVDFYFCGGYCIAVPAKTPKKEVLQIFNQHEITLGEMVKSNGRLMPDGKSNVERLEQLAKRGYALSKEDHG